MSASKDTKRGTWKVYIRYKDWQGVGQVHTKRGFATKREALEYEREFLLKKSKGRTADQSYQSLQKNLQQKSPLSKQAMQNRPKR